jgi:hypothetical protein
VDPGDVGGAVDALFEFNVFVPEWMRLEIEAYKFYTTLKQSRRVSMEMNVAGKGREGEVRTNETMFAANMSRLVTRPPRTVNVGSNMGGMVRNENVNATKRK